MEAAAAAAKAAREREQLFLRAASMGLLADVEELVAQGVPVAAVVRAASWAAFGAARLTRRWADRTRSARERSTWLPRATTAP